MGCNGTEQPPPSPAALEPMSVCLGSSVLPPWHHKVLVSRSATARPCPAMGPAWPAGRRPGPIPGPAALPGYPAAVPDPGSLPQAWSSWRPSVASALWGSPAFGRSQPAGRAGRMGVGVRVDETNTMYYYTKRAFS